MPTREGVAAAAMELVRLRTPFVHQQRQPGVGTDCVGTMVLSARAGGVEVEDYREYTRTPNPKQLLREIERRLTRIEAPELACVGLCWINEALRDVPHHLFLLVSGPRLDSGWWMVHAWMEVGRVTYNPYSEPWVSRTHSYWRLPGLED